VLPKRLATQANILANKWRHQEVRAGFGALVEGELGVEMPSLMGSFLVGQFFETAARLDVLDGITLFSRALSGLVPAEDIYDRHAFSERVMRERGMRYRVDENGVVRYYVDEAFQAVAS
jgi:hypothetical protein